MSQQHPGDWKKQPIGELCTVIAGQSPPGSAYNDNGKGLPFYQGKKDFTDRYLAAPSVWTTEVTKRALPKDILMSVRAPVGPINEAVEEICIGRGLAAIRPNEAISQEFLWYALLWLKPEIAGNEGAVFPSINKAQIELLEIPLPSPDEQKRIVAVLDQAFAALDRAHANAKVNLLDAEALFDAWLISVFHDHPSFWRTEKLRSLCRQITVGHVGPMADRYTKSGIPFLRSQNIRPFEIALNDVKRIDEKFHRELAKSALVPGDVAIVRTGYPGTAAVVPASLSVSNCADIVIVRPKEVISPEFLVMFLNSSFGKQMVAEKAVGAAQKHFNVGAAKEVGFSFPDIAEQKRLVVHAQSLRAKAQQARESCLAKLADIAALRQSLLQAAFSGQLT